VTKGSPAESAGIHEGDIIVGLEGTTITTMEQFVEKLQAYKAGTEVKIDIYRANSVGKYEKQTISVVTAEE
jgi:S1-C subfamily serine protease